MRRVLILLVITLGVYFFLAHFAELDQAWAAVQKADGLYILFCLFLTIAWQINVAASYKVIFRALGIEERMLDLILAAAASFFSNIVAPVGGATGLAVFIARARHKEYSSARTALAFALFLEFEYVSILTFLSLGFFVLIRHDQLTTLEIGAAVILAAVTAGLAGIMILGIYSGHHLVGLFNFISNIVNRVSQRLFKRGAIDCQTASEFIFEIIHGLRTLKNAPGRIVIPALLSLSSKLLQLGIFVLVMQAFQINVSIEAILASFSLGILFLIVSPTPYGIGVVEGVLILALISMQVDADAAALITIVYRGFTFWIPLLLGLAAFRLLGNSFNKTGVKID